MMFLNTIATSNFTTSTLSPAFKSGYNESNLTLSVTVTLGICIIIAIFGNILVCLAFYKQPYLKKVCYYPIISLAIADLLCGAVAMPAYIAKKHVDGGASEGVVCDVFRFSYFFTEYASVLSLTTISIERFVAIKMPIRHKNWLTKKKMIMCLVVSWLDAALVSILPFFWRRDKNNEPCQFDPTKAWSLMVILANVFLPFLVMLCCHVYTISYALRYTRRRSLPDETSQKAIKKEKDITRTFALVVGVFIICWGPSSFYYFIYMVCPTCYAGSFTKIKQIFNAVVKLLTFANSCLNPLIYCWLNPTLRRAFIATLIGKKAARKRRQEELTSFNKTNSPQESNIWQKNNKKASLLNSERHS